ncbi:hypothetical protein BDR26DRAFT_867786 [Obelidium mucronatum]|nr:hypothetical protein BDR26DRAFT_867786 [Obelidium mucronatum]
MASLPWPRLPPFSALLPAVRYRTARPTSTAASLAACLAFYGPTGLGLPLIGQFSDDAFDGVILGMPDHGHQLEFTFDKRHAGMDCRAPTKDNLLVFTLRTRKQFSRSSQVCLARVWGRLSTSRRMNGGSRMEGSQWKGQKDGESLCFTMSSKKGHYFPWNLPQSDYNPTKPKIKS